MSPETLRERWHAFWLRAKGILHRGELDRDLRDELEFHAAMREKKLSSAGLARDEARYQAARQFGNATLTRETLRETRGFPLIESIAQDARYAIRQLRRNSGFAAVAILTLALGIGVTTAVFSLVDEALFRPLPYPQGDRLVTVGVTAPIEKGEFMTSSSYYDLRDNQTPFESLASWVPGVIDCDLAEPSITRLSCARVESTFLPTLQIEPILGRNFSSTEDRPHAPQTALISYALWRGHFGEDRNVIGRIVSLDGAPVRIVGVLPLLFEMPSQAHVDILIPQALDETAQRAAHPGLILRVYARLKPGLTPAQAVAELHSVFERMVRSAPPQFRDEIHPSVRSLRAFQTESLRVALLFLFGAVLAMLLTACANIGNLLLARAASRRAEMAVRIALGAGRSRLTRQLFTESLVLTVCGGVCGCILATFLLRVFDSYTALIFPRFAQVRLDGRVLAFAAGISLLSGLLFGMAPLVSLPKAELLGSARAVNTPRSSLSWLLISFQVGASLVLLTAAGLLLRTLWKIENVNLGMDMDHVIAAQITLGKEEYSVQAPSRRILRSTGKRRVSFAWNCLVCRQRHRAARRRHERPALQRDHCRRTSGRAGGPGRHGGVARRHSRVFRNTTHSDSTRSCVYAGRPALE
jgi:predicted permease